MSLANILWIVVVGRWLLGLVTRVAGNPIHPRLRVVPVVLVYNLVVGRRAA